MVLNRPSRIILACLLLVSPGRFASAQSQPPSNQAQPGKAAKPKDGLIDFTLKRINPADRDYGQCIAEGRRILLQDTIENGFFWSNMVSLGLLGSFFLVIMYQRRLALRRELRSAESLCQVHNALARAEGEVEEAARRNRELMEALHVASEPASRTPQARGETEPRVVQVSGPAAPSGSTETQKSPPEINPGTIPVPVESRTPLKEATVTPQIAPQLRLFSPDVDQIATINALQQQLTRCQEKVKNLTRQLNDAQRRVQEEQQKNRALKGQ